jgi:low affinity Fe/Cu permease
MDTILYYSPVIIVVMVFLIQQRIVVTPEQLERKHREILRDIEARFVTLNSYEDMKSRFSEMQEKIDKIYDCLIISK